jgi:hypothetical protein
VLTSLLDDHLRFLQQVKDFTVKQFTTRCEPRLKVNVEKLDPVAKDRPTGRPFAVTGCLKILNG